MGDFAEYVLVTNDTTWGNQYWNQVLTGTSATYQFIDNSTGLFNGIRTNDWGRQGQGGQNTALNVLYYHTLI